MYLSQYRKQDIVLDFLTMISTKFARHRISHRSAALYVVFFYLPVSTEHQLSQTPDRLWCQDVGASITAHTGLDVRGQTLDLVLKELPWAQLGTWNMYFTDHQQNYTNIISCVLLLLNTDTRWEASFSYFSGQYWTKKKLLDNTMDPFRVNSPGWNPNKQISMLWTPHL